MKRPRLLGLVAAATVVIAAASPGWAAPLALTGDYLQVGISDYGTFGSDGSTEPGILHDPTGNRNFAPGGVYNDYLTPGSPHDGFAINSAQTGFIVNDNNGTSTFGTASPTLLTGAAASGYDNAATWSGSYGTSLTISNSYYFNTGDEKISIITTVTALTDLTDVAFGRSEDPDPDSNAYGTFNTINTRGDATHGAAELVSGSGEDTGLTIGILNESGDTFPHNTAISTSCCSNQDPYTVLANTDTLAYPTTNTGDYGLQIAWNLGDLTAGQSVSVAYSYVFGIHQGSVGSSSTIDTTHGDIAPDIFSLGSPAATASTVEFNGGTLRMTGGSFAGNIITAPVTIDATNGTVDTTPADGGFSGTVSGPGSLTVIGTHTFSLTGDNSYSGGTFLQGGTLLVGSDTALGTGTLTTSDGTTLLENVGVTLGNAAVLNGNTTFQTSDTTGAGEGLIYNGVISGTGTLVKTGASGLRLTAANSYTGGTVIAEGHIGVTDDLALGTGPVTFAGGFLRAVADGLTIGNDMVLQSDGRIDTRAFNFTATGTITGPGQLAKTGSGTLVLTGANTYAGGTLLSAGTIVVTNSTIAGGVATASSIGTGTLVFDGGTLLNGSTGAGLTFANGLAVNAAGGTIDANGSNLNFTAPLTDGAGSGTLTFANTGGASNGVTSLFASSTFSGGAVIDSGAFVIILADNALGQGPLDVEGGLELGTSSQSATRLTGGGIIFSNTGFGPGSGSVDTLTAQSGLFSGTIQDNAPQTIALTKTSDGSASGGTLVLSGTSLYSGPTTVAGGVLQAGSPAGLAAGSAFTVASGATLDLGGFSNTVGSIAGAGTVTNSGPTAARLTAGGNNSSTDFGGLLSDGVSPLSLTKTGSGTLALTGASTYSGGTTVLAGTLAVGNDTALGTGPVSLDDATTLQFVADGVKLANAITLSGVLDPVIDTGSGSETISGPITGPGALTKIGSGTLDLTGTNTYTGATEVAAGTLLVDGSIVNSPVTVDGGAFLGGSGSIQSAVIKSGATLSLAAQTLSITTGATFLAGSTYQVTVNADGSGSKLAVGGTASLGGARLNVLAGGGTFAARDYTLLTAAGGVSGTFGTVDLATSLALLRPQVNYGADDVVLSLRPVDFTTVAATSNQAATAGAIQALGPGSPLYNAVIPLDRPGAQQAFTAASGVSHAAPTAMVVSTNRLSSSLELDRLWDVTGSGLSAQQVLDEFAPDRMPALVRCYGPAPDPVPPRPQTYTAWGEAFGTFGHTDGGPNSGALDRSLGGFVLGLDTPLQGILGDKWRGGAAVGYTNTTYSSHIDNGTGNLQGVFGSLYAGARYGAVDVRLGTTVGGSFVDARRTVAFPGFLESEKSSNDGYSVQTFGEIGYRIPAQGFVFEPVAGLAFLHSHQNGFRETGGAAALTVSGVDSDLGTTSFGFRAEAQPFKDLPVVMHAFLAWQHVIGNVLPATTLAFESAPAGTFSVTGAPIDRDAVAAELAMDYRVSTALDVGLSYTGLVGPTAYDHSVKGRFEYRF